MLQISADFVAISIVVPRSLSADPSRFPVPTRCKLPRTRLGPMSEWPTIHPVATVNAMPLVAGELPEADFWAISVRK